MSLLDAYVVVLAMTITVAYEDHLRQGGSDAFAALRTLTRWLVR